MKKIRALFLILAAAAVLLAAGCSTINNLDQYSLTDKAIALEMSSPAGPSVSVDYHPVDFEDDQIFAFVQLGANLIKADEAGKAEEKLRSALEGMYLPEYIAELTFDRLVKDVDGLMVERSSEADIIFDVEIEDYGIESYSYGGGVYMVVEMTVRLYDIASGKIIWQRYVSVKEEAVPGFFGFDDVIGNAVSIAALGSLEEEQLAEGFQKLTGVIMKKTIKLLHDDIREARYSS